MRELFRQVEMIPVQFLLTHEDLLPLGHTAALVSIGYKAFGCVFTTLAR